MSGPLDAVWRFLTRRRRNRPARRRYDINDIIEVEDNGVQLRPRHNTNALEETDVPFEVFRLKMIAQPVYHALGRVSDVETADMMIDSLWERYVDPMPGANPGNYAIKADTLDAQIQTAADYADMQWRKLLHNKDKIKGIFDQAQQGALRRLLRANTNGDVDMQIFLDLTNATHARAAQLRRSELVSVAVDWIFSSSMTLGAHGGNTDRDNIRDAIHAVIDQNMDVTDIGTLHFLFAACGRKQALERYTGHGSWYGDLVIGRYLQSYAFERARAMRNLAVANPDFWLDLSLALLSSNIIAHGFADCNGRSCRALYACAMLGNYTQNLALNQRPFIVPDSTWLRNFVDPDFDWVQGIDELV